MEELFKKVIEHIFNNWTALKLAVEHNFVGVDGYKTTLEFINYMVNYCLYEVRVDVDSIQEVLDDIMDQEFETICEDGSTKDIASILYKFLQLLKEENTTEFENEYSKLPVNTSWLNSQHHVDTQKQSIDNSIDLPNSSSNIEVSMEEDSEWIEVKSRRK